LATAGFLRYRLIAIPAVPSSTTSSAVERHAASATASPLRRGVFAVLELGSMTNHRRAGRAWPRSPRSAFGFPTWVPSGSKTLLVEMRFAYTWCDTPVLDITPFNLAEMVTSNPGDLLARRGQDSNAVVLEPARFPDSVGDRQAVRHPWTNLLWPESAT